MPLGLTLGPQVALAAFHCDLTTNVSYQVNVSMGGVFDQHYLLYLNRWFAGNYPVTNQWVYSYSNYETDVWWTRSDTAYDLSSQKNTWAFGNYDCNQLFNPQSTNSTAWLPAWATSSSTFIYIYNGPMSTWPVLWAGLSGGGVMHTDQWTDVTKSGSFAQRLTGGFDLPKN